MVGKSVYFISKKPQSAQFEEELQRLFEDLINFEEISGCSIVRDAKHRAVLELTSLQNPMCGIPTIGPHALPSQSSSKLIPGHGHIRRSRACQIFSGT